MYLTIISLVLFLCLSPSLSTFAKASQETNLLAVANDNNLLQYYENGESKGPSFEILQAVLKEAQLEAKVEFMPWVRAFSTAKNNPNTLILSMIKTPDREADFHWIIKVSNLSRVFISLASKPENHVDHIQQAKNKLVAIVLGSANYNELTAHGFSEQKNLYIVPDSELMVTLLANGRVDLVYEDPTNIRNILNKQDKKDVDIRYKEISAENERSSYIAINKNSDMAIVNRLQQAARKFEQTPEYAELLIR
ncbi:substrate-binding periplasmic protein [Paraglaciecola hydrolytica]|uniref:substrate-binding periplasmic protein n=1 Tax=Paraglaciecola hydrolytica TaxID=1799789 RepID=UPI0009E6FFF6|nr:ABC transporter substrate-binding protein [Paraglaciecola hydrolytica]